MTKDIPGKDDFLAPQPLSGAHAFDDDDYPAYTMGRAAAMLAVTPAFLRSLGDAGLIEPQRSVGGHRRYSRHQLRLAGRARQLLDEGMPLAAACRIVALEDRLRLAHDQLDAVRRPPPGSPGEPPAA